MTPYFETLNDFFQMGGHGFYVWLCYGLVFGAIFFGIWYIKGERKRTLKRLSINQARKQGRINNE